MGYDRTGPSSPRILSAASRASTAAPPSITRRPQEPATVAAAAVAMAAAADQPTPAAPIEKERTTAPVETSVEVYGAETKLCGLELEMVIENCRGEGDL